MSTLSPEMTIPDFLRNVVSHIHPMDHSFLMFHNGKHWEDVTYGEALQKIDALSAYLLSIGMKKGDRCALLTDNCPEYVYFDQGMQQIGMVNVSIYPTLPEDEIAYILNDSGAKTIFVGTPFLFRKTLKIANECPSLMRIIPLFPDFQRYMEKLILEAGVLSFQAVLEEGMAVLTAHEHDISAAREGLLPSDLNTLIYTSGTTGTPKGVMLTHANMVNNVIACLKQIKEVDESETFLSFLPLSHAFERTATYHVCLALGARIAFAQSLELLAKNMLEVRPTVVNCVPRLLEKIHDRALKSGTAAGGYKARLFNWALSKGQAYRERLAAGKAAGMLLALQHQLANKLVFSKIKEKTGGKLKFMISGGGALPREIGEFFGNIGIRILEGYGLTETSPVVAVTEFQRQVYGTVGRILPGIEIGIWDMQTEKAIIVQTHDDFDPYFTSVEGEIIIRGHCIMKGYWNKPEETSFTFDDDGFFHTGDIGRFYRGNLQITDRIKNIIVNAYGKNVYPTPVENTYLKSARIEQFFLIGDQREYLSAIVVPNRELLEETFELDDTFFEEEAQFIEEEAIMTWVGEDIKRLSQQLAKFERIRSFKVKRLPFSIEDGELTPTLKAKRKVIEKRYAETIDALYQQN